MDERKESRRGSIVGPVILIGLGVVFLLNNLGILDWSIWDVIIRLWPVLLVAAGLDILIGRRSALGALLALILTVALIAGALWLYGTGVVMGPTGPGEEIAYDLDGAERAEIVLAPAVGSLHVEALQESNRLVAGVIHPVRGERVTRDFALEDNTAVVALRSEGNFVGPFFGAHAGQWGWELGLAPGVPLDLEISLGVGQSEIDLTDVTVSDLKVSAGIGQTTIVLPADGRFEAEIDGAIGHTLVVLPPGLEARIQCDTGLAASQVPAGYQQRDDTYTSPGYAGAENRVDLEISQAIGNVTVRHSLGR
jgi:hypothetical protein